MAIYEEASILISGNHRLRFLFILFFTATASCTDADGDGVGGLVRLTIGLRDVRTRETFTGVIVPVEGDVDASGRVRARFTFERGEPRKHIFEGWLFAPFFDRRHQAGLESERYRYLKAGHGVGYANRANHITIDTSVWKIERE